MSLRTGPPCLDFGGRWRTKCCVVVVWRLAFCPPWTGLLFCRPLYAAATVLNIAFHLIPPHPTIFCWRLMIQTSEPRQTQHFKSVAPTFWHFWRPFLPKTWPWPLGTHCSAFELVQFSAVPFQSGLNVVWFWWLWSDNEVLLVAVQSQLLHLPTLQQLLAWHSKCTVLLLFYCYCSPTGQRTIQCKWQPYFDVVKSFMLNEFNFVMLKFSLTEKCLLFTTARLSSINADS